MVPFQGTSSGVAAVTESETTGGCKVALWTEWKSFQQHFVLLQNIGLDTKQDAQKIALLLAVAGPQAKASMRLFTPRRKISLLMFYEHCSPKKNETYEWYVFGSCVQQQVTESFDAFPHGLETESEDVNLGVLQDYIIQGPIV